MSNHQETVLSYKIVDPNTYLVATVDEENLNSYCVAMGEKNQIAGLLPMHHQIVNGEFQIYFNITGKKRLRDMINMNRLGVKEGKKLLHDLLVNFRNLSEYYLRAGMCLLELDCLYIDEQFTPYLPLLPLKRETESSDAVIREFLLTLFGDCLVSENSDPYFDQILKRLLPKSFRLDEFTETQFPSHEEGQSIPNPVPDLIVKADLPVNRTPEPTPPAKPEEEVKVKSKLFGKASKCESPLPAPPFAIPGQNDHIPLPSPISVPEPVKPIKEHKAITKDSTGKRDNYSLLNIFSKKNKEGVQDKERIQIPSIPPINPAISNMQSDTRSQTSQEAPWSGTMQLNDNNSTQYLIKTEERRAWMTHNGRRIELTPLPFTVGRELCSYIINNPKISRKHLTILTMDGVYFVQDENSSNHTYLNDVIIPPYTKKALNSGDMIRLGDIVIKIELPTT